jgi:peptidoglycan glycosyltransferase
MNRSIVRLFGVVILLFALLLVWTSRWTVFSASSLDSNQLNKLQFYASLKIRRGTIYADNGEVLARSVSAGGGTWERTYPQGSLFAQAIGYYFPQQGQRPTGLEASRNSELQGQQNALTSVFGSFNGTPTVGDDIDTTLDPEAQALARRLLHGRVGAVVAIVPQTGAIKVMYSNPSYDDNHPLKYDSGDAACPNPEHVGCEFDYAAQAELPPGSTFKLVTTTAALDTGKYTPQSVINGHGPITVSGRPLENDAGEQYGEVSLTTALTDSINVVYAQVGEALGANVIQDYMQRYGFYSIPPLDYPADQMVASGERFYPDTCGHNRKILLLPVTNSCVDLGRTSIGQANLAVTPLQMAMVVSAIANGGKLIEPRLTERAINADGEVVEQVAPQEYDQVMKPRYAAQLTTMMEDVVDEGTGQAARLQGLKVAGKTGTASTGGCSRGQPAGGSCPDGQPLDDAWFVGFPVSDPKIAVAVELSDIPNGYGGVYAAPIAAQVIKTLLAENQ